MDINRKGLIDFSVVSLKADNYYAWSHDMEVALGSKRPWKFVSGVEVAQPSVQGSDTSPAPEDSDQESEDQKFDLELAIIWTAIDSSWKSLVHQLRYQLRRWKYSWKLFKFVSEASIDGKLTLLQSASLNKRNHVSEYSSAWSDMWMR